MHSHNLIKIQILCPHLAYKDLTTLFLAIINHQPKKFWNVRIITTKPKDPERSLIQNRTEHGQIFVSEACTHWYILIRLAFTGRWLVIKNKYRSLLYNKLFLLYLSQQLKFSSSTRNLKIINIQAYSKNLIPISNKV